MASPSSLYQKKIDLNNCDKEPIHLIGHIQNFGYLIALNKTSLKIEAYSQNLTTLLDLSSHKLKQISVFDIIPKHSIDKIQSEVTSVKTYATSLSIKETQFTIVAHMTANLLVLEFEKANHHIDQLRYQEDLSNIMTELNSAANEHDMCQKTVQLLKDFFEYDRVMIYKFDTNWNGKVIAEQKNELLTSWLGLQYPASDIPQQARKLFLKQGVRIIEDVNADQIPLQVTSNTTILDLSRSELRSTSPIHIEYLKNMNVNATLTAAIVYNDELWGLIACHNMNPKHLSYFQRQSCKFITQVFSNQLGLRSANTLLSKVNASNIIRSILIKQMSQNWDIHSGLSTGQHTLLDITEATGAVINIGNQLTCVGNVPTENEIQKLISFLHKNTESDLYYTSNLSGEFPEFKNIIETVSGILVIFISKSNNDVLIWFKPEILTTIDWAGKPDRKGITETNLKLSPRKSFEKWSEEQAGFSKPWLDYEIAAAKTLKENISEIIIHKYTEVNQLNEKLKRAYQDLETFSYSVSHDLRSPLRGIDGFAQVIKEDYFDSLDEFGKQAIQTIIDSTDKMNVLIDDIISFSSFNNKGLETQEFSMHELVTEVIDLLKLSLHHKLQNKAYKFIVNDLPDITTDKRMIFQLFHNLIGNAIKYSAIELTPIVEIGYFAGNYFVKDNGIGFDEKYADQIFEIFSRLVNDNYEGNGIGLAISKRIVEKHNGKIWATSKPNHGTTFYFNLKKTADA